MTSDGVAPLLLGVAGVLGAITAAVTGIRGLRQSGRAQAAASVVGQRVQALAELEAVVTGLREEITRLESTNDRDRARYDRSLAGKQAELDRQASLCTDQIRLVIEAMDVLRSVVTDEIARASAASAVLGAAQHVREQHPRPIDPPDSE